MTEKTFNNQCFGLELERKIVIATCGSAFGRLAKVLNFGGGLANCGGMPCPASRGSRGRIIPPVVDVMEAAD